jgi:hypothetical protein
MPLFVNTVTFLGYPAHDSDAMCGLLRRTQPRRRRPHWPTASTSPRKGRRVFSKDRSSVSTVPGDRLRSIHSLTTDVSLSATAGNVSADSYTSTVNATTVAGDIALQTLDGSANAKATAGNITVSLNGAGWTGTGLTVTTTAGNILLSRPVGYQAHITATARFGEVEADGKIRGSFPPPATITTGSGQPIQLTAGAGQCHRADKLTSSSPLLLAMPRVCHPYRRTLGIPLPGHTPSAVAQRQPERS